MFAWLHLRQGSWQDADQLFQWMVASCRFRDGLFGGQLLSAVGIDANDCIYPIARAVVEKENHANWRWFLELLAADLEINNSHHWAFMSDRQKVSPMNIAAY